MGFVILQGQAPGMPQGFAVQAKTLALLKESNPNEVRRFLQPVLKRLIGTDLLRSGPAELYSVFSEIPADAKAVQAVKDLLPQLDADAYEKRQAASVELAKLGPPGVLAVLRMDLAAMSEEQKARCRAFVNSYRQSDGENDWDQKRKEPYFLLDAMEDDDAAVRSAAKNQLQKVLGHEVNVDVLAAADVRSKAMDQLRKDNDKELAAKMPKTAAPDADGAADPDQAPAGVNPPMGPGVIIINN